MIAVWSLWSRPLEPRPCAHWASHKHHLMSWVLSRMTVGRHYPDTALHTDDFGKWLLVDQLGLKYNTVTTDLNALSASGVDPAWWALGKLYTYRLQTKPFVHIDNDIFLWKRLPVDLETAPAFAQNIEELDGHYYDRDQFNHLFKWFPEEWDSYQAHPHPVAYNTGIIGGNDLKIIRRYADQSIKLVEHPANATGERQFNRKAYHMVVVEQYMFAACMEHYGVKPVLLFQNGNDMYSMRTPREVGYTHLLAQSKRSPRNSENLEKRVRWQYPELYKRCVEVGERLEKDGLAWNRPVQDVA